MGDINFAAVAVCVVAAFVISTVWYSVFGNQLAAARGGNGEPGADAAAADAMRPEPRKMAVEVVRSLLLAIVIAWIAARMDVSAWTGGLQLGLVAWLGFPAVLLAGSVLWEGVKPALAAIHAGDWLVKLAVFGALIGAWR